MAQDMNLNVHHIVAESTNILATHFGGGHIYSITVGEDMDNEESWMNSVIYRFMV